MKTLFLALLLALQATTPKVAVPPYPANAFRGGNIVAVITPKDDSTRPLIVHAEEPFVEPVVNALAQWRLPSKRDERNAAVVVVNFRDWSDIEHSENGIKQNPASHSIQCDQSKFRYLPMPTVILDPFYPDATLTVTGSVVVHLKVSSSGTVKGVDVIQGIESFNKVVLEAVKQWRFSPARKDGVPIESEAYAICVYRPLQNPTNF
jgi:TonB family protein